MLYLSSAVRVFEDFTYQRWFAGDNAVVLEFSFLNPSQRMPLFDDKLIRPQSPSPSSLSCLSQVPPDQLMG